MGSQGSGVKVGTAPVSWGIWFAEDDKQMPWWRCLDEISQIGYEWIELGPYGYLPTDPDVLKGELERRSLRVSGTFAMGPLEDVEAWPALEREVVGACESLVSVGAGYLIVIDGIYSDLFTGELMRSPNLSEREWSQLIASTHRIARMAKDDFGLRAVFHPHAETHVEREDQITQFLMDTDPDLIGLCLDTGHHAYRGGDPVNFLRTHGDRVEYLHLKNVDPTLLERVNREGIPFATAVELGVFCEPAIGAIDFASLARALDEMGFEGHATVEQDMYPAQPDKPASVGDRTFEYLKEVGLGG